MILSEHFRYDIINGIKIPNVLVKQVRWNVTTKLMSAVPSRDVGVCKPETQISRRDRRNAFLRAMEVLNNVSLVDKYDTALDSTFQYDNVTVGPAVTIEEIVEVNKGKYCD